jgi:hypothetical protein
VISRSRIAALAVCCALVGCAVSAPPVDKTVLLPKLCGEDWYVVSVMGQKAGYAFMRNALEKTADGDQVLVAYEEVALQLQTPLLPQPVSAKTALHIWHDSDLVPHKYSLVADELGRERTVEAVRDGRQIVARTTVAGDTTEKRLTTGDNFGAEVELALLAAAGRLQPGKEFEFQIFNPEICDLDDVTIKVEEQTTGPVEGEQRDLFRLSMTSKKLGFTTTEWMDDSGRITEVHVGGIMGTGITLTLTTEEEALREGSPLRLTPNIPLPAPIPDSKDVSTLVLEVYSQNQEPITRLIPTTERQVVSPDADRLQGTVTIRAPTMNAEDALELPIDAPDVAEYLAATEFVQSDDPALVAKAKEIVGDERNAWLAAKKIAHWIHANMQRQKSLPTPITAKECLQGLQGDCSEHAMLFLGLARAAGIPAKFVAGLAAVHDAFWYHAWNEVYVGEGKWVAMDATWDEPLADATHIKLGEGALDTISFARVCLNTGKTMGALELRVKEYVTKDGVRHDLTSETTP